MGTDPTFRVPRAAGTATWEGCAGPDDTTLMEPHPMQLTEALLAVARTRISFATPGHRNGRCFGRSQERSVHVQ